MQWHREGLKVAVIVNDDEVIIDADLADGDAELSRKEEKP